MDCDIVLVGLNHRTAAVDVRERFALVKYTDPGTWALPLGGAIHEALILSTCNRVELLAMGKGDVIGQMLRCWAGARGAKVEDLERYIYKYTNEEAVRHLFRVASSLDSMILGEPQILGQLKAAYRKASDCHATGVILNHLLHKAFSVAKRVRTETAVASSAVSISFAAVELAKRIFGTMQGHRAMLIGAGEMAELAATHLMQNGVDEIIVANRTFAHAEELAKFYHGRAVPFEDLARHLLDVDIVITTRELAHMLKQSNIDLNSLPEEDFDSPLGQSTGAAVIFGTTGGVMEAAVRTAYEFVTHEPAPKELYTLEPVRGMQEIREAAVEIGTLHLQLAVIYGTSNVRRFLSMAKESGKHYDFIEVMTCPGGCIGGGGQPKADVEERRTMVDSRIESLYKRDVQMKLRKSHENPELKQLYEEFYRKPLSPIAEEMLHTSYTDRSGLLGEDAGKYKTLLTFDVDGAEAKNGAAAFFGEETGKNARSERTSDYEEVTMLGSATRKWKCRVCGYIYEGDNPPAECPICHMDSSYFDPVKKWKCRICGYICEDVNPPAECPICHKDSSYFDEIE